MAVQTTEEYKNGGATTYSITIEYLKASDIKVRIDGALQTYVANSPSSGEYTVSGTTVTLGAQAAAGTGNVHIYRETNVNTPAAVFAAGSSIRAADLNAVHDMARFAAVEHRNQTITADIKDGQITTAKIAADNITSALIADDQINSEHYAADSIDSEHYAPGSVDSAAIGASQVTTNELATDSVNTTKIIDLNVTRAKLENDIIDSTKLADNAVNSEHYVDGSIDHVHLANDIIDGDNIQDDVVNSEHIAAGALDNEHYAAGSITSDKLDGATVITAAEQGAATTNDTSFLTSAAADARFFNISTGDTIKDGDTFPDNDTTIATTAAINDRIIDLVDDVGGFVPIANETSFPTANPDVNNGAGTLVSIKAIGSTRTPSTGTVTIANGSGSNTVTITGCGSTVLTAGFGVIVETTSTLHTYAFHRLVPKATEVTTVAGISSNVTTVAGIASDVTSVAGISSNVTSVAGNATNINAVAGNASNINAVAADASDIGVVAADGTDIGLVAGSISNVNNVGGSIASVNTAAANLTSIATFGDQYQVASSNPSTDGGGNALAEGDLYFNTTANELKVYNGSAWQGGVTASGNFASITGNSFSGDNTYVDNAKARFGTGQDLEIFHDTNDSIINDTGDGTLKIQTGGSTKLEIQSGGVGVTGNIVVSGNVDGRDLAADGVKIDGLTSSTGVLVDGVVATTQAASDNSTKVATTAYTTTAIANINTDKIDEGDSKVEVVDSGTGGYVTTVSDNVEQIRTIPNQTTIKLLRVGENWNMADGTGTGLSFSTSNSNDIIKSTATNGFSIQGDSVALRQTGSPNNNYATFSNTGGAFLTNGTARYDYDGTNINFALNVLPDTDSNYDIGTSTKRFANAYVDAIDVTGNIATAGDIVISSAGPKISLVDTGQNPDYDILNTDGTFQVSDTTNGAVRFRINTDGHTDFLTNVDFGAGIDVTGDITAGDNDEIQLGNSQDLKIYHNATDSYITNATGDLLIDNNTTAGRTKIFTDVEFEVFVGNTEAAIKSVRSASGGQTELYHSGTKKFETTSWGVLSGGIIKSSGSSGKFQLDDGGKFSAGDSNDLLIYHDNGHSFIHQDGTGSLKILADSFRLNNEANTENIISGNAGGAVELYNAGTKRLETSGTGVSVTGALVASGDVTAFSDSRLKTDIHTINDALGTVGKLRGVNYKWLKDGKQSTGLIAQEVEAVIPEVVTTNENLTVDGVEEVKSIDYGKLVGVLIEAVKELKAELDAHKAEVAGHHGGE